MRKGFEIEFIYQIKLKFYNFKQFYNLDLYILIWLMQKLEVL